MGQEKQIKIYIFFIVLLSLSLAGSILLGVFGVYNGDVEESSTGIPIGETATIHVDGIGAHVLSYNLDGSFLAGEILKQRVLIKNDTEKSIYLRAKINIFTGDGDDPILQMQTVQGWSKQKDEYYLYDNQIASLGVVSLMNGLKISEEKQMKSEESYIVVITVESISTEFDRTEFWGY